MNKSLLNLAINVIVVYNYSNNTTRKLITDTLLINSFHCVY